MIVVALVGFAGLMAAAPQDADDGKVWSVQWTYNQNRDQAVAGESVPADAIQLRGAAAVWRKQPRGGLDMITACWTLPPVQGVPADSNGHVHQLGVGWRADTDQTPIPS